MKIGIFGGSFNPIHIMHRKIGEYLLKQHYVDKIIFVPTGDHYVYKSNLILDKDRYRMVELVCKNNSSFEVSDYELKNHVVYTIDTLQHFQDVYPNDEIYFICGADNLNYIDKWKNGIDILNNYKILVINRNTDNIDDILERLKYYKKNIIVTDMALDDLSSTKIRNDILENKDVSQYLDKEVYEYILSNQLYNKDGDIHENI